MKKPIYLDYAAATPIDDKVFAAMKPYFKNAFYNASANYMAAKEVRSAIEQARKTIAGYLGSKSNEIVFTAGGTEANNLAIKGIMESFPESNVVVSAIEHESVLEPAKRYKYKLAKVHQDGIIDLENLKKLIDDNTVLVSVIYANNEIGTIEPLTKISELISEIRKSRKALKNTLPIYLHTDACQAANYLSLQVSRLGIDLMTINAGKIYGPKQCGALYVNREVKLMPQIVGGGQEFGIRSGTENVANIIGFAEALKITQEAREGGSSKMQKLQAHFLNELNQKFPKSKINGSIRSRLPNNVSIVFPDIDNETLLIKLDENRVQCSAGSACNANKDSISHTLLAIGLSDKDAMSTLRFSMGRGTSKEDINDVIELLTAITN